jgi:hypothetical protein
MRKGFDGLYGLVRDLLGEDPLSGHLFLFTNRTHTRLKALIWGGRGLWLCAKRLEKGRFRWPREIWAADRGILRLRKNFMALPPSMQRNSEYRIGSKRVLFPACKRSTLRPPFEAVQFTPPCSSGAEFAVDRVAFVPRVRVVLTGGKALADSDSARPRGAHENPSALAIHRTYQNNFLAL